MATHQMGERCAWLDIDGLPGDTLHQFLTTIQNKPNDKDRVSERTANSYERNVRYFIEWLTDERGANPLEIDSYDLESYLIYCRRDGDKDKTIVTRRAAISRFYDELHGLAGRGDIDVEPDSLPKNPEAEYDGTWSVQESHKQQESGEKIPYLTPEEVKELWQNVPSPRVRNMAIVRLMYQTGMRVSEVTNIRHPRDIDYEAREIRIPASTSKGDSRTVAYKSSLDNLLRRWVDGGMRNAVPGSDESNYLFPTVESEKISRESIRRIVREAADSADLNHDIYTDNAGNTRTKVSPHILRHSMAVNTLKAGTMNVRELQQFLGHHSLSVTEEYLKIASDDAVDTYKAKGGPPEA
ncbi:tyrosine-type recombinase/integrase [Halogeometricum borinquense]|nr:tyrosine-type recombinase/integrase [Halogeometricum borinquense]